ncbi:hypothetical protein JCM17823_26940 [Halorubrum gandharaense]
METLEYECDFCDDTHESRFLTSLPTQALSRKEVAALNEQAQFDGVAGLEFHPCEQHPRGEIATEQLLVELDGDLLCLRLVGDVGWALEVRHELVDAADHETAIRETAAIMLEEVAPPEDHEGPHAGAHGHEH